MTTQTMQIAIQDLPARCNFIHNDELLSNGYGHLLTDNWQARLRGEPYCTIRCTNGYAVYCDLPGETLVIPVSVQVDAHDMPYHLFVERVQP